jgi:hypothetical protein
MSSRSFRSASTDIEARLLLAISIFRKRQYGRISETNKGRLNVNGAREVQTSLPACLMILDVIGDLLADGRQIEELLLDKGIFGLFGKFSYMAACCRKYSSQSMLRRAPQGHEHIMSDRSRAREH